MKLPRLTLRRVLLTGALLLLAAGVAAPFFRAGEFESRIRETLEQSLGRRVEMEDVRFSLFRGPGFSLRKVVIGEDPAFGIEPFAYVSSIEARVHLRSLWTGRLEFSSLRLVEPSVNFTKPAQGPWNFQAMLSRAPGGDLPEIQVRRGRINFKFGDVKSVFYFSDADLDISPPADSGGSFTVSFTGEPARTDRTSLAFGKLTGRGRWRVSPAAGQNLRLDVRLERSAISELVTLMHGRDIGVHGWVIAAASLEGPLSNLRISGDLQLEEIHRWDLMPPYAEGGPLRFQGRLDLPAERIELETIARENSALSVRFRASNYLSSPRWGLILSLNQLSLQPVLEVARQMGSPVPDGLAAEGGLSGVIGFSPESGFQGVVSIPAATVRTASGLPVQFERTQLTLAGSRLRLLSGLVRAERGETAELEADYLPATGELDLVISAHNLRVGQGSGGDALFLGIIKAPHLGAFRGGVVAGRMRYRRPKDGPGAWQGALNLKEASVAVPGLAAPFEVEEARLLLHQDGFVIERASGRIGDAGAQVEFRYEPKAKRPAQWSCRVSEIDGTELEKLLMPALRRERGFLSRTLGIGRTPAPAWMQNRHTQGVLHIGVLHADGWPLEEVNARIFWDQTTLEVTDFSAKLHNGSVHGRITADLRGTEPAYELNASVRGMSWKGGRLDWDGRFRTRGTGAELRASLYGEGSFDGHSLALSPDTTLGRITGDFQMNWRGAIPVFMLRDVRAAVARDVFIGQGSTDPSGRLDLTLASAAGELHLTGMLLAPPPASVSR